MERIEKAFLKYPRYLFVSNEQWEQSYLDIPIPIGFGQTNSQPTTVKMMLDWLDVEPGQNILDVGSGSGWTTALLSYLTGPKGKVIAVEIIPELAEFGKNNALRAGVKNASFYMGDKELGKKQYSPYDRILVSAAASTIPKNLLSQLANKGKAVIPVKNDVLEIYKISEKKFEIIPHSGFMFVPLVS